MYFELNIFHCIKTYTKVLETSSNNLHVILLKMKIHVILHSMQNMHNHKNSSVRLYVHFDCLAVGKNDLPI